MAFLEKSKSFIGGQCLQGRKLFRYLQLYLPLMAIKLYPILQKCFSKSFLRSEILLRIILYLLSFSMRGKAVMVWHFEKCTHWIATFGNINPIFITTKMLPKVTIQELIQQYPALCGVKGNFISHLSFCCSFAPCLVSVPLVGQGSLFFKKWSFSYKFTFEV